MFSTFPVVVSWITTVWVVVPTFAFTTRIILLAPATYAETAPLTDRIPLLFCTASALADPEPILLADGQFCPDMIALSDRVHGLTEPKANFVPLGRVTVRLFAAQGAAVGGLVLDCTTACIPADCPCWLAPVSV